MIFGVWTFWFDFGVLSLGSSLGDRDQLVGVYFEGVRSGFELLWVSLGFGMKVEDEGLSCSYEHDEGLMVVSGLVRWLCRLGFIVKVMVL